MGLFEVNEAAEVVTGAADQNANVIFGAVIDHALKDEVRVTVIATGFGPERYRRRRREERPRTAVGDGRRRSARRLRGPGRRARSAVVPARLLAASVQETGPEVLGALPSRRALRRSSRGTGQPLRTSG